MRCRSLLCAFAAALAASSDGAANTTPSSWAQAEITAVVAAGLMADDAATFRPDSLAA